MCKLDHNIIMRDRCREQQLRDVGTVPSAWSGQAEEAFKLLKDTICMAPGLTLPEEEGE